MTILKPYVLPIHRTGDRRPIQTGPDRTGPVWSNKDRTAAPKHAKKKIRNLEISLLSKSQPPTTLGAQKNAEKPKPPKLEKLVSEIRFALFLLGFGGATDLGTSKSVSS